MVQAPCCFLVILVVCTKPELKGIYVKDNIEIIHNIQGLMVENKTILGLHK